MADVLEASKRFGYGIFGSHHSSLEALLEPKNIAVFGATHEAGKVGNSLLKNLLNASFYGNIFPINTAGESIFDVPAYTHLEAVPDQVDLAVIATPISIVPGILEACVAAGVKSAIVISPGFRETGAIGRSLEQQLRDKLSLGAMRLLGPNSLGVMNPRKGLNATLSNTLARPGNIGFISQSGALCRAVLDWSFHENVGFSAFISLGSMLDIDWGDLISYLGDDPYTQSIVIHMEAIGDARSFLAAAREVAPIKPIILLKGGRTEAAVKAAIAHTGGIVGSDDVLEAALQRCGVLRVNRISELFNMAEVLAKRKFQPQGNRLTIITNSGGLGVLATDALIVTGGQLGPLAPETLARLDEVLPSDWGRSNPIDILGDADSDRFRQTLEIAVQDPRTDGLLVILAPQGVADPTETAEQLKDVVNQLQFTPLGHKPILASWVGGAEVLAGETILNRHQIPTYPYPDSAARLFNLMWQHSYCLQGMYEVPDLPTQWAGGGPQRAIARQVIETALGTGRTTLTSLETATLLEAYGMPMVESHWVNHADQGVMIARQMGYPLLVRPNLSTGDVWQTPSELVHDATSLCAAYHRLVQHADEPTVVLQPLIAEAGAYAFILSSAVDPQFGPVIRLGTGRWFPDISGEPVSDRRHHRVAALPPLNAALAQRLLEQTALYPALQGCKGYPAVDLAALKTLLIQFSQLVVEQPWIRTIEINPLLVRPVAVVAEPHRDRPPNFVITHAHISLHAPSTAPETLPRPVLRPYPSQYVSTQVLTDGTPLTLRLIRPSDEPLLMAFSEQLAAPDRPPSGTRYPSLGQLNLYGTMAQVTRLCFLDQDREMALVAECLTPAGLPILKGLGRLSKQPDGQSGSVSLQVSASDRELATLLLQALIQMARGEHLQSLETPIANYLQLPEIYQEAGFVRHSSPTHPTARLDLNTPP